MRKICRSAGIVCLALMSGTLWAQVAGQNINMVSGTQWPSGDPFLQRQNEPSMAVSSRNPEHLLAGANDYRTVDIPNSESPNETGDAWLGVFTSMDGGETWKSTLMPGYPQDTSTVGTSSPLHQFTVATDPTVRAGTHGLFYVSGLGFNRGSGSPSGVFVAVFQDQNNKGNGNAAILQGSSSAQTGNPFAYIGAALLDTGNSGQFLDKPWVAVDIPRSNRTATCKVGGQSIQSGYVYAVWTQFNGSKNNPSSKIKASVSTNCGASWSQPQILSQSEKLAQGTVAAIDPSNGNVHIAWRQIGVAGSQNQPDAIQYAYSTNGGNSYVWTNPVHTFVGSSASYPPGSVFDQPSGAEFRTLDVPSIAVDASSHVWIAYSQRVNGPTTGTYGSRIMVTTLPSGSSTWTTPYVVDQSSPTTTAYGHQFMPALSFAFGKMMLAWFDSRNDNKETVLACNGGSCTNLSQLAAQSAPIPGSTIATTGPASVFTPNILDPNSGIRHTIDVFGALIDPTTQSNKPVPSFQISQYPFWVNDNDSDQIEQGFFNPPNLPMFAQGTLPFVGDYIDIGAQNIVPSGTGWSFNTQGKDTATGATLAPDFHVTWTDNRDVVPPPVLSGSQNWTLYNPPNSGNSTSSIYFGNGSACPTCATVQPACTAAESGYSGDRNENVYTSRISNGLIVRFRENAKQLSTTVPTRSFSLLAKNTVSPLSTSPLGAPSFYRIMLGVTSTTQTPTCTIVGGTASLSASGCTPFIDVAIDPKTTFTQSITVSSSATAPNVPALVAQISSIPPPGTSPVFVGLQALAAINSDPSNPSVANPDFLSTDNSNPDASSPYGILSISAGETYDPAVDGPPDPSINTPKIGAPLINTPKIGTLANNTPKIDTPTIVAVGINTPKIFSVQVVNPTIVDLINTPKINTPKIVSPEIFTPKITAPSELTDYTWNVTNKGNTTSSYNTAEFVKSSGVQCCPASCSANPNTCGFTCSVCQLIQHKVYESPVANRDSNGNPTCDLNVQQESIVVANISDPAFIAGGVGGGSPSNPTNSTLALSPGEGNRVTLRVVAPPAPQTTPFKTVAAGQNPDSNGQAPISLTIQTAALPVAVVNQAYTGAQLSSLGGVGGTLWSVPEDPTNPVPVLGAGPFTLPVSPLTLAESGQIGTSTVTQATGTYTFFVQVQDSATTNGTLTPTFDVQQLTFEVNQFTISSVDPMITNEVGSTGYMKAGDQATVSVTINNQGPATATSVAPTLTVNEASGGTPPGPTPVVNCGSPSPGPSPISGNGNQTFSFNCTAVSGNGYVTFTAHATGQYVNSPAATVTATATPVSAPNLSPSGTPPNIIVDTVPPTLTFASANPAPNQYGWNNTQVTFNYTNGDNLSGVNTSAPNPLVLSTEGRNVTGQVTVTDFAKNAQVFTAPTSSMPAVNIDLTAPTITPNSSYTPGTWTDQNVTVQFNCTDNLSGPLYVSGGVMNPIITGIPSIGSTLTYSQQGALTSIATVTLTAETASTTLKANCQDFAGNNASQVSFGPIEIDKTPPVLTVAATIPPSSPYSAGTWTNQGVTVTYSCTDTASAVANSGVAAGSPNPPQIIFTQQTPLAGTSASGTCSDVAGNVAANAPLLFQPILIDLTPPIVSITSPAAAVYINNQQIGASYSCTDALSGVASCVGGSAPVGLIASGNSFMQTTPGPYVFGVTGTDVAGNQAPATVNYSTAYYNFSGFQSPLSAAAGPTPASAPPSAPTNSGSFVQGATIPILWQLASTATSSLGQQISDPTTLTSLSAYPYGNSTCTGGAPPPNTPIQLSSATYDATNLRFQSLWNTGTVTSGCYYLLITFNDLSSYATNVNIMSPVITTVAGNNALGGHYSGDGGAATSAALNDPYGVAVDGSGNVYIADSVNSVIREVTAATGIITTAAGNNALGGGYSGDGGAATSAALNDPYGVAVDSAGNLYIADAGNNVIRKVTVATGIISTVAGNGTLGYGGDGGAATSAALNDPTGVAVDSAGNLYIADDDNHVIREVTAANGIITTVAGNNALGGHYSGDGGAATNAALNHPTGVAVDRAGNLYIADEANNVIREVTAATGIITTAAGSNALGGGYSGDGGAATSAQFRNPLGVAVDIAGNLYIADSANNVIREVTAATGIIATVAGNNALGGGYSGDSGPPNSAALNGPSGVAVDSAGNFYIADFFNNVIRKVGP